MPPEILAVIALSLYAALTDVRRLEIDNWVSVAIVALFMLYAATMPIVWAPHVAVMLVTLALGLIVHRMGVMGGGDIKLLSALSLWAGVHGLPALLLGTSIAGAGVAMATLWLHKNQTVCADTGLAWIDAARSETPHVAYGIAIAIGAVILFTTTPMGG